MRRLAALAAIVIVGAVLAVTVVMAFRYPGRWIVVFALVAGLALAGWYAVTRAGRTRTIAAALAVAAAAGVVAVFVVGSPLSVAVRLALLVAAGGLGRHAVARDVRTLKGLGDRGHAGRRGASRRADHVGSGHRSCTARVTTVRT